MRAFDSLHPVVPLFYFMAMIFITVFTLNPVILGLSFLGALVLCGILNGAGELFKSLAYSLPLMIIIAVTNPIFVHRGETLLFFLNDNPVTLEAIIYGASASVMLMSVFYWFKCYNRVMTSDKFIYLFGRIIPKLSLLISMTLSFVPKFKRRFGEIDRAQRALGIYSGKGFVDKLRLKMRVLSILVSWSLENNVQTADSMRARGYDLKGRTSYALFRWTLRDSFMIVAVALLTAAVCMLTANGWADFAYYPTISRLTFDIPQALLYTAMLLLCFISAATEVRENILWHYLKSKI